MICDFALRLICGLATVWCLLPRRQITSGFFRVQMLLTLGLSVLAALTQDQLTFADAGLASSLRTFMTVLAWTLAALSFLGSLLWTLERRSGGTGCGVLICLWSTVAVGVVSLTRQGGGLAAVVDALTSAWLIGSVTSAMLLGHWYLTATGMPLTPLIQYNAVAGAAAALRLGVVVMSGTASGSWPILILRGAGVLGPLLLAGLVHRILKYRNTQSATGVLYASTILVFLGEMASVLSIRAN